MKETENIFMQWSYPYLKWLKKLLNWVLYQEWYTEAVQQAAVLVKSFYSNNFQKNKMLY